MQKWHVGRHEGCNRQSMTCQEHAPTNDGNDEIAGLGHKLEWAIEVEQGENVLHTTTHSAATSALLTYTLIFTR